MKTDILIGKNIFQKGKVLSKFKCHEVPYSSICGVIRIKKLLLQSVNRRNILSKHTKEPIHLSKFNVKLSIISLLNVLRCTCSDNDKINNNKANSIQANAILFRQLIWLSISFE